MDENSGWEILKGYCKGAVGVASCVYGVNISLSILHGLSYMQASALANASIFPAMVGGIVGVTAYRIFLKFPRFSIVLAIALCLSTYAIIGSFLIQPVNGVEALFVSYDKPILSFVSGFFNGIVSGFACVNLFYRDALK